MEKKVKFPEESGARIAYCRRREGLTQEEFGNKLGVSRQTINAYENERQMPPFKMIDTICEVFGIAPWWLVYGIGGPHSELRDLPLYTIESPAPNKKGLTPEQNVLIDYIRKSKRAAQVLATGLMDLGLGGVNLEGVLREMCQVEQQATQEEPGSV